MNFEILQKLTDKFSDKFDKFEVDIRYRDLLTIQLLKNKNAERLQAIKSNATKQKSTLMSISWCNFKLQLLLEHLNEASE